MEKTELGEVSMLLGQLHVKGWYEIKNTSAGWWVDGCCGYLVAGYFKSKREAISEALVEINSARENGRQPSWLFT